MVGFGLGGGGGFSGGEVGGVPVSKGGGGGGPETIDVEAAGGVAPLGIVLPPREKLFIADTSVKWTMKDFWAQRDAGGIQSLVCIAPPNFDVVRFKLGRYWTEEGTVHDDYAHRDSTGKSVGGSYSDNPLWVLGSNPNGLFTAGPGVSGDFCSFPDNPKSLPEGILPPSRQKGLDRRNRQSVIGATVEYKWSDLPAQTEETCPGCFSDERKETLVIGQGGVVGGAASTWGLNTVETWVWSVNSGLAPGKPEDYMRDGWPFNSAFGAYGVHGKIFFDHAFDLELPFTDKQANASSLPGVEYVSIKPTYNFFIESYEARISKDDVDERMLPNMYAFLLVEQEQDPDDIITLEKSKYITSGPADIFEKHLTLNQTITNTLYALNKEGLPLAKDVLSGEAEERSRGEVLYSPEEPKKAKKIHKKSDGFAKGSGGQYFDKFARSYDLFKSTLNLSGDPPSPSRTLMNKFSNLVVPMSNLNLYRDFHHKRLQFPMYTDISFLTDSTKTSVADMLKDADLSSIFMKDIVSAGTDYATDLTMRKDVAAVAAAEAGRSEVRGGGILGAAAVAEQRPRDDDPQLSERSGADVIIPWIFDYGTGRRNDGPAVLVFWGYSGRSQRNTLDARNATDPALKEWQPGGGMWTHLSNLNHRSNALKRNPNSGRDGSYRIGDQVYLKNGPQGYTLNGVARLGVIIAYVGNSKYVNDIKRQPVGETNQYRIHANQPIWPEPQNPLALKHWWQSQIRNKNTGGNPRFATRYKVTEDVQIARQAFYLWGAQPFGQNSIPRRDGTQTNVIAGQTAAGAIEGGGMSAVGGGGTSGLRRAGSSVAPGDIGGERSGWAAAEGRIKGKAAYTAGGTVARGHRGENYSMTNLSRKRSSSHVFNEWDITEWLEGFVAEALQGTSHMAGINDMVFLGQFNEDILAAGGRDKPNTSDKTGKRWLDAIRFAGKLNKLIKEKTRSYQQILAGKKAYSETLFYKLEKWSVDGDGAFVGGAPIQSIFFPNSSDTPLHRYVDTQVKYNKRYGYRIYAFELVFGTRYRYSLNDITGLKRLYPEQHDPTYENLRVEYATWSPISKAEICVFAAPSLKLIQVPWFESVGRVMDAPPVWPDVDVIQYKNHNNKVLFFLRGNVGEYKLKPIPIELNDYEEIDGLREAQQVQNFSDPLKYRSDDQARTFEIFRMDTKPSSYAEFEDHKLVDVETDVFIDPKKAATSAGFADTILPNKKYYYIFRTIDIHGHTSNPTPIYEIEIVDNDGGPVLMTNIFWLKQEKVPPQMPTKKAAKYIYITPNLEQLEINQEKNKLIDPNTGLNKGEVPQDVKNNGARLGISGEVVWDKKYKIRVISKKTRRKIDFNIQCKVKPWKPTDQGTPSG